MITTELTSIPVSDWADLILPAGQPRLHEALRLLRGRVDARIAGSVDPLRVYVDGPTGTGKTTLARLVAGKLPGAVTREIDGSRLTQSDLDFVAGTGFCWRILIVNEAQNIRDAKADLLMSGLDGMGKRAAVIFTTMRKGSKQAPLFGAWDVDRAITDRCFCVSLTNQGIKSPDNVKRVLAMAQAAGLDYGAGEKQVENLFESRGNSIRGVLEAVSEGALS